MTPVVHLHFHGRRTGITRHVEDVARLLPAEVVGWGLSAEVPRLTWGGLRARMRAGAVVLHAHRNLELLAALLLRARSPSVRVVFTRHSAGRPSAWTRFLARRADALARMRQSGVDVLDVDPRQLTPQLLNRYLLLKSRNRL